MNKSFFEHKSSEPGSIENPIVDSKLTLKEALRENPEFFLPPEFFEQQILLQMMLRIFLISCWKKISQ